MQKPFKAGSLNSTAQTFQVVLGEASNEKDRKQTYLIGLPKRNISKHARREWSIRKQFSNFYFKSTLNRVNRKDGLT